MYELIIGDRNYSSWSLRAWLLMQALDIEFTERLVPITGAGPSPVHRPYSDNGLVPCLHDEGFRIWDTLAIAEYLHERHGGVWPADAQARARARSVSAEMHSGFGVIRESMPMNIKLRLVGRDPSPAEAQEIERICTIWDECRQDWAAATSGPFLFGAFSAADAMFAPIAWRFETYNVPLQGAAADYQQALLSMPEMKAWQAQAIAESHVMAYDDVVSRFGGLRQD